ncbi:hypothetical protein PR048_021424 [Dryococelus australis]|uniref:Uncharacterized protein n=1 Tax=Dryococelus australis TaxID=614101 RepID=A0ABQ9GY90_9NEOP|nr:hypothetical protein PR048_021424 [Dryococelus australis]
MDGRKGGICIHRPPPPCVFVHVSEGLLLALDGCDIDRRTSLGAGSFAIDMVRKSGSLFNGLLQTLRKRAAQAVCHYYHFTDLKHCRSRARVSGKTMQEVSSYTCLRENKLHNTKANGTGVSSGEERLVHRQPVRSVRTRVSKLRGQWEIRKRVVKAARRSPLKVPHDENTARQFRQTIALSGDGGLMSMVVSHLTLPRLSASNAEKSSRGRGGTASGSRASQQGEPGSIPGEVAPGFLTRENHAGRYPWSAGFLRNPPFSPLLHSGAAPRREKESRVQGVGGSERCSRPPPS